MPFTAEELAILCTALTIAVESGAIFPAAATEQETMAARHKLSAQIAEIERKIYSLIQGSL